VEGVIQILGRQGVNGEDAVGPEVTPEGEGGREGGKEGGREGVSMAFRGSMVKTRWEQKSRLKRKEGGREGGREGVKGRMSVQKLQISTNPPSFCPSLPPSFPPSPLRQLRRRHSPIVVNRECTQVFLFFLFLLPSLPPFLLPALLLLAAQNFGLQAVEHLLRGREGGREGGRGGKKMIR